MASFGQVGDVASMDGTRATQNMWNLQEKFRGSRTPAVEKAFSEAGWMSQIPYNSEGMLRALIMTLGEEGTRQVLTEMENPNLTPGQVNALRAKLLGAMRASDDINRPSGVLKSSQNMQSAVEQARQAGQGADKVLAHIHPVEAQLLEQTFGSSGPNPQTGLPQYGRSLNGGLASRLTGLVKTAAQRAPTRSRLDLFREELAGLGQPQQAAPGLPVPAKPLPAPGQMQTMGPNAVSPFQNANPNAAFLRGMALPGNRYGQQMGNPNPGQGMAPPQFLNAFLQGRGQRPQQNNPYGQARQMGPMNWMSRFGR